MTPPLQARCAPGSTTRSLVWAQDGALLWGTGHPQAGSVWRWTPGADAPVLGWGPLPAPPDALLGLPDGRIVFAQGREVWVGRAGQAPTLLGRHNQRSWCWGLWGLDEGQVASAGTDGRLRVLALDGGGERAQVDTRRARAVRAEHGRVWLGRARRQPGAVWVSAEDALGGAGGWRLRVPLPSDAALVAINLEFQPGSGRLALALALREATRQRSVLGLAGPEGFQAVGEGSAPLEAPNPPLTELRWVGPRWLLAAGAAGSLAWDTQGGGPRPVGRVWAADDAGRVLTEAGELLLLKQGARAVVCPPAPQPPGDALAALDPGGRWLALGRAGRLEIFALEDRRSRLS